MKLNYNIMNKLAIIDGDGLCYHASKDTLEESIEVLNEKINNIFEKTEATHYIMFLSYMPYFRHSIFPEYKSNRSKTKSPLKWLKTLKSYLVENWNAQNIKGVEADDAVCYWMNKDICINEEGTHFETRESWESVNCILDETNEEHVKYKSVEKIMCAVDKDLVKSIAGKHFNYTYKLKEKGNPNSVIKGWWVETSVEDSYTNFWVSMICGDAGDGIKGLPGKGEGFIKKQYVDLSILNDSMVYYHYLVHYGEAQGIYEFQKNFRLLHMLNCDEDFLREVGEIPQMPEINKVILNSQIENNIDLTKLEF